MGSQILIQVCWWEIIALIMLVSMFINVGHNIMLRWGGPTLLILSLTITSISSKRLESNLGVSLVRTVVECLNFIDDVWFKRIETIKYLKLCLDVSSLAVKHLLHIFHKVSALSPSVANQATFCANLVNSFIAALDPGSVAIV